MIAQASGKIVRHFIVLTAMGLLAACGSAPPMVAPSDASEPHREVSRSSRAVPVGERAAAVAMSQIGVPYRYGGNSTTGFDCSGLVQYSYARVGKNVPRTTGQQWSAVTTVKLADLQAGDLLFFSIEGKMSHVGMYIGDNEFVHAPSSGRTVTTASLDSPYYSQAFLRAGRP